MFIYFTFRVSTVHCVIKNLIGETIFKDSFSEIRSQRFSPKLFYKKINLIFSSAHSKKETFIFVSGFNYKRFSFLQEFFNTFPQLPNTTLFYLSNTSYNGCRLRKKRRL